MRRRTLPSLENHARPRRGTALANEAQLAWRTLTQRAEESRGLASDDRKETDNEVK